MDFESIDKGSNPLPVANNGGINMNTNMKKCSKCGRFLPLTEFYSRGGGKYRSDCKTCHKNYVKEKYNERKEMVNEIKTSQGCEKCGDTRSYVLDFHHIDPSIKDSTIARLTSNRNQVEDIQEEIDKCIVLCANCHREFHYLQNREHITIEQFLS